MKSSAFNVASLFSTQTSLTRVLQGAGDGESLRLLTPNSEEVMPSPGAGRNSSGFAQRGMGSSGTALGTAGALRPFPILVGIPWQPIPLSFTYSCGSHGLPGTETSGSSGWKSVCRPAGMGRETLPKAQHPHLPSCGSHGLGADSLPLPVQQSCSQGSCLATGTRVQGTAVARVQPEHQHSPWWSRSRAPGSHPWPSCAHWVPSLG